MKLGAILKSCRTWAGLTQEDMAEKLHRSPSCISKFENDKKTLDAQTLFEWAKATQANDVFIALLQGMDWIEVLQNITTLLG